MSEARRKMKNKRGCDVQTTMHFI